MLNLINGNQMKGMMQNYNLKNNVIANMQGHEFNPNYFANNPALSN